MFSKSLLQRINIIVLLSLSTLSVTTFAGKQKDIQKLPVLWDFGAKKCRACKMMAPILEKMKVEYKGKLIVRFTDVWIRENVQLAKEHGIKSIPTQIFLNENGKELWRHTGYISEEDILAKWKSLGYNFSKTKINNEVSKQNSNILKGIEN